MASTSSAGANGELGKPWPGPGKSTRSARRHGKNGKIDVEMPPIDQVIEDH